MAEPNLLYHTLTIHVPNRICLPVAAAVAACSQPAFPPGLDPDLGAELVTVWALLSSFPTLLGVPAMSLEQLLEALVVGQGSRLCGQIHCQLIRLVQVRGGVRGV